MIDWKSLEDPLIELEAAAPRKTYTCGQCFGTGRYQGPRVHQEKSHCFACGGKGYFLSSKQAREKAREKASERRDRTRKEGLKEFSQEHAGLMIVFSLNDDKMATTGFGNSFLQSLSQQLRSKGTLSEKQIAAAYRSVEKDAERKRQREAEKAAREASAPEVDLAPIKAMFDAAVESGYKRPKYRAEGLVLSRAPDTGKNPGSLYVTADEGDTYYGRISDGRFYGARGGDKALSGLKVIANDPSGAAVAYGRRTGRCACCGRELTNHGSIDRGIGPVCAERWGL